MAGQGELIVVKVFATRIVAIVGFPDVIVPGRW
jgi:hypothetical protein